MSAPIVACAMVEAMAPLLKQLHTALGAKATLQYFPASAESYEFWSVNIWDHGVCFSGDDRSDPALALIKANTKRQQHAPVQVLAA